MAVLRNQDLEKHMYSNWSKGSDVAGTGALGGGGGAGG